MEENNTSNLDVYRHEAKTASMRLIKKSCEYLLARNKKISPQSTYEIMVEIADNHEQKYIIKPTTLRRKNLKWRGIIDEYEAYRLNNPVNKTSVDVDAKFAEQRLSQQNYMLREKILDLSDEVATLSSALEKVKSQSSQEQHSSSSLMEMVPSDNTDDNYRTVLSGVIYQLLNHTYLVEIDTNGNLKAFGKDGKIMLLNADSLSKLDIYGQDK